MEEEEFEDLYVALYHDTYTNISSSYEYLPMENIDEIMIRRVNRSIEITAE